MTDGNPPIAPILDAYHVKYRHVTGNQAICCPVHDEKHPSCTVNLTEGWYRCHGCDSRGDGYQLVKELEGVDFPTAKSIVEKLTGFSGEHLPAANHSGSRSIFHGTRHQQRNSDRLQTGVRRRTITGR